MKSELSVSNKRTEENEGDNKKGSHCCCHLFAGILTFGQVLQDCFESVKFCKHRKFKMEENEWII